MYKLIQNDDKCANGKRLEFLPREKASGTSSKDKNRDVCFVSTACSIVKEADSKQSKKSYVENGCVRKFKINGQLFIELAKFDE